ADRTIIARALAKDPAQRFPSCMDLVRALEGEGAATAIPSGTPEAQTAVASQPMAETLTYALPDSGQASQRCPVLPPDVLVGHVFAEPLENSPSHESWKVQTPDGQLRVVKLLYGLGNPTPKLKENVLYLRSLHHPALVPGDVVSVEPGRLILITDLVKG